MLYYHLLTKVWNSSFEDVSVCLVSGKNTTLSVLCIYSEYSQHMPVSNIMRMIQIWQKYEHIWLARVRYQGKDKTLLWHVFNIGRNPKNELLGDHLARRRSIILRGNKNLLFFWRENSNYAVQFCVALLYLNTSDIITS